MQLSEDPELNVVGVGPTLGAAFAEAAPAMIALLTDPAAIRLQETIEIDCAAPSSERLLAERLNAVLSKMAAREMIFRAFNVETDGFQLPAAASGEHAAFARESNCTLGARYARA